MKTLGNIIWFIFGGLELAIAYFVLGIIQLIFVVTIPFALQSFKLGLYTLWPFGRALVQGDPEKKPSTIGNVLWFVFAGLWLAIGHVIAGIVMLITIIGIPLAPTHFKLASAALMPFGKEVVPLSVARQMGHNVATVGETA